ncbi:hypothetical protein KEJ36_03245, partial [Candidatus Bathyarchaeota archaeon]|nr:hypothetical protein [Candidatus Bathyarchaeota archaeon]
MAKIPGLGKELKSLSLDRKDRQVCVPEDGSKNLAPAESKEEPAAREGATNANAEDARKIIGFLWHLRKGAKERLGLWSQSRGSGKRQGGPRKKTKTEAWEKKLV